MEDIRTFITMGRLGSGKGTQAKLLAEKIGARVYSSGKEFRDLAASEQFVGRRLKKALDSGELMPTWLASYLHEKTLFTLEPEDKIIFEGACRIEPEAHLFNEVTEWLGRPYKVIYLEIDEEEMVKRLRKRYEIEGRADDADEAITIRIQEFNTKTIPAANFFRSQGKLITVNGQQTVEKVHEDILKALSLS